MVRGTGPDAVIVAGADHTHETYIVKALEHDLDVITEKPMAVTGEECRKILEAEAKSKGRVSVTFNYRYMPIHARIKELILEGKIGRVTSVDLTGTSTPTMVPAISNAGTGKEATREACPFTKARITSIW